MGKDLVHVLGVLLDVVLFLIELALLVIVLGVLFGFGDLDHLLNWMCAGLSERIPG